jgi:DNA-directed RNA polymerase subunit RPC12/RpoP
MSINFQNDHLICPCGKDLGEIKNEKKGYICEECNSLWLLKDKSEEILKKIKKGKIKTSVLDWLKKDCSL